MKDIRVIAHNLRSAHNVGSLLRTAEGLGINEVILTGYTPYPSLAHNDPRLPHERIKIDKLIQKTALNAQATQAWRQETDVFAAIKQLKRDGFMIAALEQTPTSVLLPDYQAPDKIVILLGREVDGVEPEVLDACDLPLEIPMFGHKESYNVVQAAAMALYQLRCIA